MLRASTVLAAGLAAVTMPMAQAGEAVGLASRVEGAVMGALVADALALGTHYEYDAQKIARAVGQGTLDKLTGPGELFGGTTHGVGWGERNYHPGRGAGEHTDYGDNVLYMLQYLSEADSAEAVTPFTGQDYYKSWSKHYAGWDRGADCRACGAWVDTMARTVLQRVGRGRWQPSAAGFSNGMVIRFPAALGVYTDVEDLVQAARASTSFTNANPEPIAAAEFWARVVFAVAHAPEDDTDLLDTMRQAASSTRDAFVIEKVSQALAKAAEASDPQRPLSREPLADDLALTSMARLWDVGKSEPIKVGKASPTEGTLPGAVYFLAKYSTLREAAVANALVGGDTAARAVPIGMVLGARHGIPGLPQDLVNQLKWRETARTWVANLPLLRQGQADEL